MSASTCFPMPDSWLEHRVSFGETDPMGIVYYAEYLHLFERGRSHHMRCKGLSYLDVERQGFNLPVREAACRYRSPIHYDDLVYIRTGIDKWGRASIGFVYEITDHDKTKLLATGMTLHACTDASGKPVAVPAWLKDAMS